MNKTQIKKALSHKIKFGRSPSLCAMGNYLFEDALPYSENPYQSVYKFNKKDYEECTNAVDYVKSVDFKKEKWYIKQSFGSVVEFYLWKRIS